MKKLLLITFLLLLAVFLIKAQDTVKRKSQPDSLIKILPQTNVRHSDFIYSINGKLQSPDDIKAKLLGYPPSALELKAAQNNFKWSFISLGGAAACGIGAVIAYKNADKYYAPNTGVVNGEPTLVYREHSKTVAYVLTGMVAGFLTTEFITLIKASKHSRKAFKVYNDQYR